MIRLLLVLVLGLGIGYTYGYLQGDAGDDNLVEGAMSRVGGRRSINGAQASVARLKHEEAQRQAVIDSIKQAREDSVASRIHP